MDLSTLDIPDTIAVHLEFPNIGKLYADDDKEQPMVIKLYSPASAQAVAYNHKVQKQAIKRIGKRGLKAASMSPEEIEEQTISRLVAFTADVSNLVYEGETVELNQIAKVYSNPKMGWINDQLNERLGSWDNFLEQ